MKLSKIVGLVVVAAVVAIATVMVHNRVYPSPDISAALRAEYTESCLAPTVEPRPVWECYEIPVDAAEFESVTIQHRDGEQHQVLTFTEDGQTKFRFTPTKLGTWTFSTGGEIDINAERPDYAKGFVAAEGSKWVRTATGEAFVPQFIMYDKPDLDAGLTEFVGEHGFTGFHVTNLRDFLENPAYFEAVVLKTYRQGGVTHFWIWGDERRNQTPETYGVDVERLYQEIAARLAPLPGWTLGYGFDLFEWASAEELETFRDTMHSYSSYHHLFGGRGHKNEYKEISPNLDFASWEWHQPSYQDYRDHLAKADGRPAFSEDRFRIRTPSRYPEKDYNPELTHRGLWQSAIAGGIANIWGHQPRDQEFSEPYPNKAAIRTYSQFIDKTFTVGMEPDNDLISNGHCLRDGDAIAICYAEDAAEVTLNLDPIQSPQVFAVDTQTTYEEIKLPSDSSSLTWSAPQTSDWAFAIISQDNR